MYNMHAWCPWKVEKEIESAESEVKDGCDYLEGAENPGFLQEQWVFLATKASLQAWLTYLKGIFQHTEDGLKESW